VRKCFKDILRKGKPGWPRVYCAANTLISKDPLECVTGPQGSTECVTCVNDIMDFGWDYAFEKWDILKTSGPKAGGQCVSVDMLPPDLLECQGGIRIQYLLAGEWVTYRALPNGFRLCPGSGSFNSASNPELFNSKVRFAQCSAMYDATGEICPGQETDRCDSKEGMKLAIVIKQTEEFSQVGVVDMVEKGILICNPKKYPNGSKECFEKPVVACAGCVGVCPKEVWTPPCKDCPICPPQGDIE